MFGVRRGFTRGTDMPDLSVSPEAPANMDPMTRVLSQAMLPTEVNYTIQDGDTLSEIARDADTTVEELKELNNIENIDEIDAGANLKVPVKAGKLTDTQAALRRGLDRPKDNQGVETAMSIVPSSVLSDASAVVDTSLRPQMRPTDSSSLPDGEYFSAEHMSDLEILARTIEAEAASESKEGKLAVGAVIKNRVDKQSWMGKDVKSVILKPGQFSPWNSYTSYAGGEQGQAMLTSANKPSKDSYEAAKKILDGKYKDPTGGATHFVNPKVGTKPSWYKKFKKNTVEKIGRHEFGSPDDPTWDLQSSLRPKQRPKGLGAK
jgi:spore germination cell wall hydrolase CwlJ-like protein